MAFLERLSHKIGDDLVRSGVVKEEDAEVYIYGINQIMAYVFNVSSSLIIGLIFGVTFEIIIFMAAYIPLRTFAGGYHAKTPLRCYIFSVIMLIIVSIGMKHLSPADWVYYAVLAASVFVILVLSPVEDQNKPLDEVEHKVYKRRTMLIAAVEVVICFSLWMMKLHNLFAAVVYSFTVLGFMLIAGKVKNLFSDC